MFESLDKSRGGGRCLGFLVLSPMAESVLRLGAWPIETWGDRPTPASEGLRSSTRIMLDWFGCERDRVENHWPSRVGSVLLLVLLYSPVPAMCAPYIDCCTGTLWACIITAGLGEAVRLYEVLIHPRLEPGFDPILALGIGDPPVDMSVKPKFLVDTGAGVIVLLWSALR